MKRDPRPLLKMAVEIIKKGDSETPVLDAELLFIKAMEDAGEYVSRIRVSAGLEMEIPEAVEEQLLRMAEQRKSGRPIQYMTGTQEFMGLEFHVREGVLIPRPDTEILVEELLKERKEENKGIRFLDLCTGSGAIGIALLHFWKEAKGVLVDIEEVAHEVAQENAMRLGVSDRCVILKGDLFEPLGDLRFDLIVSNPPYIPTGDMKDLMGGVKDFEPHVALDGGMDGLDFYRKITEESVKYIKGKGILAFEIGYDQGEKVKKIMEETGYENVRVLQDLAGHDRCVLGALRYTTGQL